MSELISIIIPSIEEVKTDFPKEYEVIISKSKGIPKARNDGAKLAHGDTLLFLDSDQKPKEGFFEALGINNNEFKMLKLHQYPCSRVVLISTKNFLRIGGFNEKLIHSPEDIDFYFRAIDSGLSFTEFPNLVENIEHLRNAHWKTLINNLKYGLRIFPKHPDYLQYELRRGLIVPIARKLSN